MNSAPFTPSYTFINLINNKNPENENPVYNKSTWTLYIAILKQSLH